MNSQLIIRDPVLVLVGPTAIGKTELSLQLAEKFQCEIVSVDSMQVYRFMDIGTAKVGAAERARVPHHLIDLVDPDADYDAACFVRDALRAVATIHRRGKIPLLTGGTGLYLRALLQGLFSDREEYPEIRAQLQKRLVENGPNQLYKELLLCDRFSAERIHCNDTHRLLRALEVYQATGRPWSEHINEHRQQRPCCFEKLLQIGLTCDRDLLYQRINQRTTTMIKGGLAQEVQELMARGYGPQLKSMQAIGYRHMVQYLQNIWDLSETEGVLARDTRRYAKRQFTWFRAVPDLHWFNIADTKTVMNKIASWV